MKIAINKCYGGFDLSESAQRRLIELGVPYYKSFDDIPNDYNGLYIVNNDSKMFGSYSDNFNGYEYRTNPLLISVIEELGKSASGKFGEIIIVEVPDDVEWDIEEYDGIEWIAEKHNTWG